MEFIWFVQLKKLENNVAENLYVIENVVCQSDLQNDYLIILISKKLTQTAEEIRCVFDDI